MSWRGKAKIEFIHSSTPREFRRNDGRVINLLDICQRTTPPCELNPLLFNGHFQTLWTATKPPGPQIFYKRRIFECEDQDLGGSYAVDFVVDPFEEQDPSLYRRIVHFSDSELNYMGSDDDKPMLVVLHGLSGGSHEVYLRHALEPMVGDGGWEACVINARGCAKSEMTGGPIYNARSTGDCRQTINWLRKRFPNRKLFGLGFSIGANILTLYCGEEGANCPLSGAVSCSNPFNLEVVFKTLQARLLGRKLYLKVLGQSMKALVTTHKPQIAKYTDVSDDVMQQVISLEDYDRLIACPSWGYPTTQAYYRDASSCDAVLAIKIPFLAISATDDPIAVKEALPIEEFESNPYTILMTTTLGGHVCWFESGGRRWYSRPISNFFNYLAREVDLDNSKDIPTRLPRPLNRKTSSFTFNPMQRKHSAATIVS